LSVSVARNGVLKNAYKILVGNPKGNRPLGRPNSRCEDMRTDLRQTGWEGVDWMHLAQDRDQLRDFVNTVMNHQVP